VAISLDELRVRVQAYQRESQTTKLKRAVVDQHGSYGRARSRPCRSHVAVSSAMRQLRQLRQGYLNGCEGSFIMELYGYNRHLRKTLPTLLALPSCSSINHKRTATPRQDLPKLPYTGDVLASASIRLGILSIFELLIDACGRDT
jgi:hypothetical protein